MNLSKRVVVSLLVTAIILFLGLLFWPFILNYIIRPMALVIWLILRILVLSIPQKYFWFAAIFVGFIVLYRILPRESSDIQSDIYPETNTTMINIGYWRGLFTYNDQNLQGEKTLKRELTYLLISLYASKQGTATSFVIHDDLQQGRIPLPENIHSFLFPPESSVSGGRLQSFVHSVQKTPRKWMRQWTGQEKAEHYQMINEVLKFMETSMEINNDDGNPT